MIKLTKPTRNVIYTLGVLTLFSSVTINLVNKDAYSELCVVMLSACLNEWQLTYELTVKSITSIYWIWYEYQIYFITTANIAAGNPNFPLALHICSYSIPVVLDSYIPPILPLFTSLVFPTDIRINTIFGAIALSVDKMTFKYYDARQHTYAIVLYGE